ncbi:TraM recognition domain-containing protein, partial [Lactococcus hodotermopsidis]|uniref:TraM recognition domain-containing protein n=1 Tax=Pseudolactococcus hodotermopsidis TaxID=2709157 RepID=UPI001556E9B4
KIVLVSLNKGVTGAESARFLGSLLVSLTWSLALKRAEIPPEKRHRISLFIDELQDYLRLPTDLADALSQARGLGLSLTLAHQYRHQLSQNIKMAIDANCRNKICFGLDMNDAQELAKQAPELVAEDFYHLPQYHIYAKLPNNGNSSGWLSGKTFPKPPATRNYSDLVAKSALKYGTPTSEIEADFSKQFGFSDLHSLKNTSENLDKNSEKIPKTRPQNIGRRKKNTAD